MADITTKFLPGGGVATNTVGVAPPTMGPLGMNFGAPDPAWWQFLRQMSARRLHKASEQPSGGGGGPQTAVREIQGPTPDRGEDPTARNLRIALQNAAAEKAMWESQAPPKHYVYPGMGLYGTDKETDYDRMPLSMQPNANLQPSGPPQASQDWQAEHPPTPEHGPSDGRDTRADFFGTGTTDVNQQRAIMRAIKAQQDQQDYGSSGY